MRVVAIIQARLGSQRFPRKILADLCGKPVLQHVINRVAAIDGLYSIVVACPASDREAINRALAKYGPGDTPDYPAAYPDVPDADVLGRFARVAIEHPADAYLRITGDCPLIDPAVCYMVLQRFHEESADFASNDTTQSGYPDGLDCEVFTRSLLERAHREATDLHDREHVTSWMKRAAGVRTVLVTAPRPYPPDKLSVDTPDDLARVAQILRGQ